MGGSISFTSLVVDTSISGRIGLTWTDTENNGSTITTLNINAVDKNSNQYGFSTTIDGTYITQTGTQTSPKYELIIYDKNTNVNLLNLVPGSLVQFTINCSGTGTVNPYTTTTGGPNNDGYYLVPNSLCFKIGTKILCENDEYLLIEQLSVGQKVKTLKNGYLPIHRVEKSVTHHSHENPTLYICKTDKYPQLVEDLIVTGEHSLLVESLTVPQLNKMAELGTIYVTDDKLRLFARYDEKAAVYEKDGDHIIYHLSVEDENPDINHGIYANGLLVETCSKHCISFM